MLLVEHSRQAATALNRIAWHNRYSVCAASQRALDREQWDYSHCLDKALCGFASLLKCIIKILGILRKAADAALEGLYGKHVKKAYPLVGGAYSQVEGYSKTVSKLLVVHFGSIGTSTFIRSNDTAIP